MAEMRSLHHHSRVYAEYLRRDHKFDTFTMGFPGVDCIERSVRYLLLGSMARVLESGGNHGSENVSDVSVLYPDRCYWMDDMNNCDDSYQHIASPDLEDTMRGYAIVPARAGTSPLIRYNVYTFGPAFT